MWHMRLRMLLMAAYALCSHGAFGCLWLPTRIWCKRHIGWPTWQAMLLMATHVHVARAVHMAHTLHMLHAATFMAANFWEHALPRADYCADAIRCITGRFGSGCGLPKEDACLLRGSVEGCVHKDGGLACSSRPAHLDERVLPRIITRITHA